jgi:pimeloyl-ACP methyl ester carboxylesterase
LPRFASNGLNLYYEEHGKGEPLVLMAGFGQDPSAWAEQVDIFARYFRVILLDLRGAGPSDVPEAAFTPRDLADDVVNLMNLLGLERIHFGGFSLGGAVGMEFAIAHPEKLASLSLHSTWEATEPYPHFAQWIEIRQRIIAANDPVVNVGTRLVSFFSPEFVNERQDRIKLFIERARNNPTPITPKGIAAQGQACISHDVRGRLDRIRVPTLITVGTKDRTTLPASSEYLHRHIAGSEYVVINGAGHCTMFQAPEEFASISLGFLLKHAGRHV